MGVNEDLRSLQAEVKRLEVEIRALQEEARDQKKFWDNAIKVARWSVGAVVILTSSVSIAAISRAVHSYVSKVIKERVGSSTDPLDFVARRLTLKDKAGKDRIAVGVDEDTESAFVTVLGDNGTRRVHITDNAPHEKTSIIPDRQPEDVKSSVILYEYEGRKRLAVFTSGERYAKHSVGIRYYDANGVGQNYEYYPRY